MLIPSICLRTSTGRCTADSTVRYCIINLHLSNTDSCHAQVLARPPRGNTVCDHHNISRKQLARVQFAELVQVGVLLPFSCTLMPGCTAHQLHL